MTYYIYHIPGKKIGVTRNLQERVTKQQGYEESEYDILMQSDDISYISERELELQKAFGYKVDRQSYETLKPNNNKMKINSSIELNSETFAATATAGTGGIFNS